MVSPLSGLSLQGAPSNTLQSVLGGRQSYEQSQLNSQALKQGEQQISRADYDQATQRLGVINRLAEKARSLATPQERDGFINSINPEMLKSVGIDPASIANAPRDDQGLDALIAQTSAALPKTRSTGEAASFNEMTKDLTSDERERARRINLGLDPRATGSAAITIADRGISGQVGESEAEIARLKELATGGVKLALSPEQKRREAQSQADVELATKPNIASATTSATEQAKSAADAKSALPKAEAAADRTIGLIDELLAHPGRDIATGSTSWVPAIPGTKQADFINRFDQVKGKAFLQAFESLKGAGAITEQEGAKASQAFSRLNRATSKPEFDDAAEDLKAEIAQLKSIAVSKANKGNTGKQTQDAETVNWSDL